MCVEMLCSRFVVCCLLCVECRLLIAVCNVLFAAVLVGCWSLFVIRLS